MKSNKGFSLVELIVVIAIMAIIAAVAIPVYSSYITAAEKSTLESQIAEFVHSVELDYIIENPRAAKSEVTVSLNEDSEVLVKINGAATGSDFATGKTTSNAFGDPIVCDGYTTITANADGTYTLG